ncbi:hypothetical protein PT2222_80003 [Paraburkholderia tropica]
MRAGGRFRRVETGGIGWHWLEWSAIAPDRAGTGKDAGPARGSRGAGPGAGSGGHQTGIRRASTDGSSLFRRFGEDLPDRVFEGFHRLTAADQILLVEHDGRHRLDAHRLRLLFLAAHFVGIRTGFEHLARLSGVEPDRLRDGHQHRVIAHVLAFAVIGAQQRHLERHLPAFQTRPVEQAMRVEGVVDARARTERETDALAPLADRFLSLGDLLGRAAVLLAEILDDGFAVRPHVGVQFERMDGHAGLDGIAEIGERALQRAEADRAPRAGDVGNEVDLKRLCHGDSGKWTR